MLYISNNQVEISIPDTWVAVEIPVNATLAYMILIGGGGSGGAGEAAASAAGGGGGAAAAHASYCFNAQCLPPIVYVFCGNSTGITYVCTAPDSSVANNIIAASGTATGTMNGAAGVGGVGGAGGTAGSIALAANTVFSSLSNRIYIAGGNGGAGGASNAVGANAAQLNGRITTPGTGGGGQNGASTRQGGSQTGGDETGTFTSGAGDGVRGADGILFYKPWQPLAGGGGGSSLSVGGGNGGNGQYGSGGGGGGACPIGQTPGAGGVGGAGYFYMATY